MSTIANRVKKGAELLDTAQPNWYEQIELSQLDLSSCRKCILGQMFGDFSDGAEVLFKDELSSSIDKCGFDIDRELLLDRKSTRLNSSHVAISYAVFCLKKQTEKSSMIYINAMLNTV